MKYVYVKHCVLNCPLNNWNGNFCRLDYKPLFGKRACTAPLKALGQHSGRTRVRGGNRALNLAFLSQSASWSYPSYCITKEERKFLFFVERNRCCHKSCSLFWDVSIWLTSKPLSLVYCIVYIVAVLSLPTCVCSGVLNLYHHNFVNNHCQYLFSRLCKIDFTCRYFLVVYNIWL